MSKKSVTSSTEVYSSSDAIKFFQYRQSQGDNINIEKIGEVQYKIGVSGKGDIHLNDNPRTLPKEQRNMVRFWIFCLLGSTVAVAIAIFLWTG